MPKHARKWFPILLALSLAATLCAGCGKSVVTYVYLSSGETVAERAAERSIADVVDQVADTVVEVYCTVPVQSWWGVVGESTSAGSGVFFGEDGHIVTNHHVIEGASKIVVRTRNNAQYTAKLVGSDSKNDIAVLKISAKSDGAFPAAVFGDSDALRVGQTAIVIGNPLGTLGGTVTDGIISALGRDITIDGTTMHLLQTNASINSGNSGGGLFDLDGRLIGVVNAKSTGNNVEGLGFAIPANTAVEVIAKLMG